ncbi:MAG: glyoxalase [Gammaproteobacteria bacterium]|nr:glyoxalase [Gammaproteobacteria bacterium]|tara:strand:+ start:642 stop:1025 length:384 start_codon:yes stop_codon:yes gene_type:complete
MKKTLGIRHIALKIKNFEQCLKFYTDVFGMKIDWQPDNKNVYLTNGLDNLALHLNENLQDDNSQNRLDHFGIMLQKSEDVDYWYSYIQSKNVKIHKQINSHRDGSRSFYCCDPDGNVIQVIWHPSSK